MATFEVKVTLQQGVEFFRENPDLIDPKIKEKANEVSSIDEIVALDSITQCQLIASLDKKKGKELLDRLEASNKEEKEKLIR